MFVFVFLLIMVLPAFFFPFSTNGGLNQPKILQAGNWAKEEGVEPFKTIMLPKGADNGLEAMGFQGFDIEKFCKDVCKGQIE